MSEVVPPGHALIISFTNLANEPRVVRQALALLNRGWRVTLAGHRCEQTVPDGCHFVELQRPAGMPVHLLPWSFLTLSGSRIWSRLGDAYYWLRPEHRSFAVALVDHRADLVISHDYFTIPLGAWLAKTWQAKFVIDSHEYAMGQYPGHRQWNTMYAPYVRALQQRHFPKADAVITVSAGIARCLVSDHALAKLPIVVRNTPPYEPMQYRSAGEKIEVLYHGLIAPMRELDLLIESFEKVRPEFQLVLRGPGDASYINHLKGVAQRSGVMERVSFRKSVPLHDLVRVANESDVGIFHSRDLTPQMEFVLPNKLFEYIMAGLAVCVSDVPEMAGLVNEYRVGCQIRDVSTDGIAQAINELSRDTIDVFKKNSLVAARQLCWERECRAFLQACQIEPT